jgi:acyl carrier protein
MTDPAYDALRDIFVRLFGLPSVEDAEDAAYGQTRGWDSLGHVALVQRIEDEFDILMGPEDIIDMESFTRTCEVLTKYGIDGLSRGRGRTSHGRI